ncbi:MAG: hypothetical protein QNJ22_21790 [Desulfosarcinaceae bacterium]|nr:hypothetical protein [Desulfosarcinaceae bacterium]
MAGMIILSAICIASAVLLWHMAHRRGANTFFWALMGALFGPLAIPFLLLAKGKPPPPRQSDDR